MFTLEQEGQKSGGAMPPPVWKVERPLAPLALPPPCSAAYETKGGALSNKQRMEVFLRHVGDPGFQTGVGEDMGIH